MPSTKHLRTHPVLCEPVFGLTSHFDWVRNCFHFKGLTIRPSGQEVAAPQEICFAGVFCMFTLTIWAPMDSLGRSMATAIPKILSKSDYQPVTLSRLAPKTL